MKQIEDYSEYFEGEHQDLGRQIYIVSKVNSQVLLNDSQNHVPSDNEKFESMILPASYYLHVIKSNYIKYYEYVMSMVIAELTLYSFGNSEICDIIGEENMTKFILSRFDLYMKEVNNIYKSKEDGKTYLMPLLINKLYIDPLSVSETIDDPKYSENIDYLRLPLIFLSRLGSFIQTSEIISVLISNIEKGNVKTS